MRRIVAVIVAAVPVLAIRKAWRHNPRMGSAFVNTVINPLLVRRGLAGGRHSEIGVLEHVGRTSGVRRLTPVHPEPTADGFRVLVPLGAESQWARNVLAAGRCQMHLHEEVYDLDEPAVVSAAEEANLPWLVRRIMGSLGFQYIHLRTFAVSRESPSLVAPPKPLHEARLAVPAGT